ncbi:GNAT family N-acetyltransferase [Streptacidiphilus fuscans]|uniref:GNAT family N-acetyltransferase n=1 Tax=Streptacidiphilus fuscans TaxID=2789292 RepID=A0A931B1Q0_9ACTN|nr:GNAT family N-acetyltransferase [Streptacidiphilus fuscans]MBF9068769.1 GNAT family N-acetyltransferase [Streptacidiphilus fuscans]
MVLRSKAHWGYDAAFIDACRDELTLSADDLTRRHVMVAERGGHAVGIAALGEGEPPEGALDLLYVDPSAIGQGVGGLLFAQACAVARAAGFSRLTIDADPHAEAFYLSRGAVRIGESPSGSIPGRMLPLLAVELDGRR